MNRAGAGVLPMETVGLKNQPDNETSALVELSKVDLENRRVQAMSRIATAMLASTCLLLLLVLGLVLVIGIMLNRLNDSIADIADSVGPAAVSNAVATMQASLDNVQGTTGNFLTMSGDATAMGAKLLQAANESVSILQHTNHLAEDLLAHPTIRMDLGGGGASP